MGAFAPPSLLATFSNIYEVVALLEFVIEVSLE